MPEEKVVLLKSDIVTRRDLIRKEIKDVKRMNTFYEELIKVKREGDRRSYIDIRKVI